MGKSKCKEHNQLVKYPVNRGYRLDLADCPPPSNIFSQLCGVSMVYSRAEFDVRCSPKTHASEILTQDEYALCYNWNMVCSNITHSSYLAQREPRCGGQTLIYLKVFSQSRLEPGPTNIGRCAVGSRTALAHVLLYIPDPSATNGTQ